jgi:hypothetical protein
MALVPNLVYGQTQLQPARNPEDARLLNVALKASTSYLRGQVLGQMTGTELNAVQVLAITGTATGGSVVFTTGAYPFTSGGPTTVTLPYNATLAQAQAGFDAAYGAGNTVVSGGPWPGSALTVNFTGALSAQPITTMTQTNTLTGTTPGVTITPTAGVVNTGLWGPYAHGNSDGTQVGKLLLMYPCTTDASGNISIGSGGGGSDIPGYTQSHAPAYYAGIFRTEELAGLPTAGNLAADLPGARIIVGDLVSGLIALPV